ncbi:berberine bridge enzyme-like 8 [Phalaenopsis equestris]|uniref:berberine bridge enzyme-like 8 n=1 Tax=Phalaenopsis equestris TaxID=78828 RepID=UPI0009E62A28|nr:berberine bridge enzyme-like 8 [Phalaenopsis equestris]XP_020599907.1 berberine bridge enzyme-like 8 [Phalaenopsis equestris]XP_020599908.1 berberine bridge enzyme-like 8 [Phalaenopsis equestris]XP_020599911.1 berberine bridge enzyme-like 8 [Phalaenopsis equestris]XP_020599912.1 berberine bridge enzyme-like 8 [Phalaenopsis equestris]
MVPVLFILISNLLAVSSTTTTSIQSFIQCFTNQNNNSNPLSFPNTTSYHSILLSSVQNQRFLISPSSYKPSLIVSATTASQVQAAITCARAASLRLRTRSGGHDYEGMSYSAFKGPDSTPFISLDLSGLRSISIDASSKTGWVQAGATLGELYYAIAKKSKTLAFPAGLCSTVGVGGHLSAGGIGTLTRKYGASVDNIIDAQLVDVNGRLFNRKAMGEDLFWAIRGAGSAGYGVIIAFKIKLVVVPPVVTAFNVGRTLRQNATKVVARWQELAHQFDVNLYIRVIAQASTDMDGSKTIQVTFNSLYLGRQEELIPLAKRSFPELGLKTTDCTEMSWIESVQFLYSGSGKTLEMMLDRKPEFNSSFKGTSDFVQHPIAEGRIEEIWKFMIEANDEPLVLILDPMGGRISEIKEDATAFPHRKGNIYNLQYFMRWFETEEGLTEKHLIWMRKFYEFMTPYVSSKPRAAYYNYKDIDLGRNVEGRVTSYWEARVWGTKYFKGNFWRLAKVKAKVDPENFFWNEQSIPVLQSLGVLREFF